MKKIENNKEVINANREAIVETKESINETKASIEQIIIKMDEKFTSEIGLLKDKTTENLESAVHNLKEEFNKKNQV